jgi:S1-C subfamily serine protease
MFLLAVNLGLAMSRLNADQLAKTEIDVWNSVKGSVVVLLREGIPSGQAALIDKSGLFLAHQDVVFTSTTKGRLADGRMVVLDWKSTDPSTQTVLLQAENWKSEAQPVSLGDPSTTPPSGSVLVVLPAGPVKGQMSSKTQLAVLASRHLFALGEVLFEATAQNIGGALVFDRNAHLVGLLNATLEPVESVGAPKFATPGKPVAQNSLQRNLQGNGYGPGQMMVGYTVQSDVLRRIVSGFTSPSHRVQHPAIGIYCKDFP